MSDDELEQLALWEENVKAEIQSRIEAENNSSSLKTTGIVKAVVEQEVTTEENNPVAMPEVPSAVTD